MGDRERHLDRRRAARRRACGRRRPSMTESGTLHLTIANPSPDQDGSARKGINLFTQRVRHAGSEDREAEVVLPAGPPRPLGLRRRAAADAVRRAGRRPDGQGDRCGEQERLRLHPESRDRQADQPDRRDARADRDRDRRVRRSGRRSRSPTRRRASRWCRRRRRWSRRSTRVTPSYPKVPFYTPPTRRVPSTRRAKRCTTAAARSARARACCMWRARTCRSS